MLTFVFFQNKSAFSHFTPLLSLSPFTLLLHVSFFVRIYFSPMGGRHAIGLRTSGRQDGGWETDVGGRRPREVTQRSPVARDFFILGSRSFRPWLAIFPSLAGDQRASSVALEWWRRMDHNREQFSMATGSRPRSNLDDRIVTSTATVPFGFCFLFLSPTPARFIRPSCDDGGSFRRRYSRGGNRWSARFRYFGLGFWLFWDWFGVDT